MTEELPKCPKCETPINYGAKSCPCGWKEKKDWKPIAPEQKCSQCGSTEINRQVAGWERGEDGKRYHVIKNSWCYEHTPVPLRDWRDNLSEHFARHKDIEAAREYVAKFETRHEGNPIQREAEKSEPKHVSEFV